MGQKNYAIEFWRFFLCVVYLFVHTFMVYAPTEWHMAPIVWNMNNLPVIMPFFIFTGYFLMASFKKNHSKAVEKGITPTGEAWGYLSARLKGLMPAFIFANLLGLVLQAFWRPIPLAVLPMRILDGLGEMLGLHITGLGMGNNFAGPFAGPASGSILMNAPVWFISGIFICGYVIYFLLSKNEHLFAGLVFPVGTLLFYGWAHINNFNPIWFMYIFNGAVNSGLFHLFLGMGLGCTLYYGIEKYKNIELSKGVVAILTIAQAACSIIVIWHTVAPFGLYFTTVHIISTIMAFLTILNRDLFTKLLNLKIFNIPGKIALYIFIFHYPVIGLVAMIIGTSNLMAIALITLAITIVVSLLFMLLNDKFIASMFSKKKETVAA